MIFSPPANPVHTRPARIVHDLPGRLRIRLPGLAGRDASFVRALLELQDGVRQVRVNAAAASIIVAYDGQSATKNRLLREITLLPGREEALSAPRSQPGAHPLLAAMILGASRLLPAQLTRWMTWIAITGNLVRGVRTLLTQGVKVEVLDAMALGAAALRGDHPTALATRFFLEMGDHLQESTNQRMEGLARHLFLPLPEFASVEREGKVEHRPLADLQPGDLVLVETGMAIPVDGEVVEGVARVNQASLTGENLPVRKEAGNPALSGSVVEEGRLRIRAVRVGDKTALARIRQFLETSFHSGSRTQVMAETLAQRRVRYTLGAAGLVMAATRDPRRASSALLVDFSCGIKMATPTAFKSAMLKASREGILFKGGQAVESLAEVDTFVFDKTGTLTESSLEIDQTLSFFPEDCSGERILSVVASLEEHTSHPVAEAVVRHAHSRVLPHVSHGEVEFIIAHGLFAEVEGHRLQIGSRHFLEEDLGISFAPFAAQLEALTQAGLILLLVARDQRPMGVIALRDRVRPDAASTLRQLRGLGVKQLVMLTGDRREKALGLAQELGIDTVHAELAPEEKAGIVAALRERGRVIAFVGDGINDAPALAAAQVGIALPRGADLARQTADVLLLRDHLAPLVAARELAMGAMATIRGNFNAAVVVNSAILAASSAGLLSPVVTSLLHNGATIGLMANALTVSRRRAAR